jgi:hypothetical protein
MEAIGGFGAGLIDKERLTLIEKTALPGSGTCSAMFTGIYLNVILYRNVRKASFMHSVLSSAYTYPKRGVASA